MLRILVVEDAPNLRQRLCAVLGSASLGYRLRESANAREALAEVAEWQPNLVLLDLAIPTNATATDPDWRNGREALRRLRATAPHTRVIVLTDHGELARDFLLEEGANDFFAKGDPRLWRAGRLQVQVAAQIGHLACASPPMQELRRRLDELTESRRVVVLEGEPGSGRRHVAAILHRNSRRAHRECRVLSLTGAAAEDVSRVVVGTPAREGALAEAAVGTVLVADACRAQPSGQVALAELCLSLAREELPVSPDRQPKTAHLVLLIDQSLSERYAAGDLTEELFRALSPGVGGVASVLHVLSLLERREDVPLLLDHFAREAALAQEKTLLSVHPEVAAVVALAEQVTSAAQLRQLVVRAVEGSAGEELLPSDLPVELPERYHVLYNDGGGRREERLSARDLSRFLDAERFELVVFLTRNEQDRLTVRTLRSGGSEVRLEDPRLLRLLLLLLRNAGERVDLKAAKRRLGVGPAEPMKRFLFELRQALNDPVLEKTQSHYFTGHWGEACTFSGSVRFALVTELRQGGVPDAADPD